MAETAPPPNPHELRSFAQILSAIEDGRLHSDLSSAAVDLVAAMENHVAEHGGKAAGKISLTIDLKLDGGVFEVVGEHKITAPKPKARRTLMWATPDNRLSRTDPRQQQLPLREVAHAPAPVRTA